MKTEPLTVEAYRPYGDVISARADVKPRPANMGTARRYDWLAALENLRPAARPNVCLFRSEPFTAGDFPVRLLERHPFTTQAFIPMNCPEHYLVVVALGGESGPDLSTLRAFLVQKDQGITYRPGVWHHPLIALGATTDFACVVFEDESDGDCDVRKLATPVSVQLGDSQ